MGSARSLVDADFHARTVTKHTNYAKQFEQGTLQTVHKHNVVIARADGTWHEVPYDVLVLATGTQYDLFKAQAVTLEARREEIHTRQKEIASAGSVLVIGGGPVGIETAGEVACKYPDKQVTLVHAGPRVLDKFPQRVSEKISTQLAQSKVNVILEERYTHSTGNIHHFSSGRQVEADLILPATGFHVPTQYATRGILQHARDARGFIRVQPTLQVEGHANIFAAGDVTNTRESKQFAVMRGHVSSVSRNVERFIQDQSLSVHKINTMNGGVFVVGPRQGVFAPPVGGITLAGGFPARIKNRIMLDLPK